MRQRWKFLLRFVSASRFFRGQFTGCPQCNDEQVLPSSQLQELRRQGIPDRLEATAAGNPEAEANGNKLHSDGVDDKKNLLRTPFRCHPNRGHPPAHMLNKFCV